MISSQDMVLYNGGLLKGWTLQKGEVSRERNGYQADYPVYFVFVVSCVFVFIGFWLAHNHQDSMHWIGQLQDLLEIDTALIWGHGGKIIQTY